MFFDSNVPYSNSGYVLGGPLPVGILKRVEMFSVHAINLPLKIIRTILEQWHKNTNKTINNLFASFTNYTDNRESKEECLVDYGIITRQ